MDSLVAALAGALFAVFAKDWFDWYKREKTWDSLTLAVDGEFTARAFNDSDMMIEGCWAYISIDDQIGTDLFIKDPDKHDYYEGFGDIYKARVESKVHEDRLAWSLQDHNRKNPPSIDILPGERQRLMIAKFVETRSFPITPTNSEPDVRRWLGFPSERGYDGLRIALNPDRRWKGTIKLVSKTIPAKVFPFIYDPASGMRIFSGHRHH